MINRKHILVVDDELNNLQVLERFLEEEDYKVTCVKNAAETLKITTEIEFDLILLDIGLPGMDGFELCKRLKADAITKTIPIIFITGRRDSDSVAQGLELGASDYIGKPLNGVELLARVKTHLGLKSFQDDLEDLVRLRTNELQQEIDQRILTEKNLEESNRKLQKLMQDNLNLLASVVEIRDPFTAGHQQNVARFATLIAEEMKLKQDVIDSIKVAATIHDIGKIKVPLEILSKGGKLLDLEMEIIKTHPLVGYELLKDIEFPWPIADIVLQHHERLDGSGYPHGLKDKEIMFEAKLLGLADVVEAITYHKPYRAGLGLSNAVEDIENNKGILYDPELVEVSIKLINEKNFKF